MLNAVKDGGKPPLVFNSIVDPFAVSGGIVKSPTDKPGWVTGLQALPPVEDAMRLAQRCVPSARKFGLIWNPTEANSAVVTGVARESAPKVGVELIEQTVSKSDEVLQAAQALIAKGGVAPYTWALLGGALLPGLSFDPAGKIVGRVDKVGDSTVTLMVSDSEGATAQAEVRIRATYYRSGGGSRGPPWVRLAPDSTA